MLKYVSFIALCLNACLVQGMTPGTLIEPTCYAQPFTVNIPQSAVNGSRALLTKDSSLSSLEISALAQTHGVPVIINFATGQSPWWALTAGTGFLLQELCIEAVFSALLSGFGFAAGQACGQALKENLYNLSYSYASRLALACASSGLSYYFTNDFCQTLSANFSHALLMQTALELSMHWYNSRGATSNQKASGSFMGAHLDSAWLSTCKAGIIATLITAQGTKILKVLLFEQAYRLAKEGCLSAQKFIEGNQ